MSLLDPERWRAVSPYLDRAMEMGTEELARWMASLRAEQPALAADLETLLGDRAASDQEGFLNDARALLPREGADLNAAAGQLGTGHADSTTPPPSVGHAPGTIGPYRPVRLLGEGGMGLVYLAEQAEPIRREVALKVIRPDLDSAKVLARFGLERQVLANLSHPGISKVYDAGALPDGRPYVAMEYVAGSNLTHYCDGQRLSVRKRLELFLQVCDAIQHAHQRGVIHRDIKPSNLLVSVADGRPLVKVIDFGIAKALQPSPVDPLLTQAGAMLGTPEYMSPEQASLDADGVDTRSDVYALGVVLYELLAGARPFEVRDLPDGATPLTLLEAVRGKDPPKLTTRLLGSDDPPADVALQRGTDLKRLIRELGGELEWITLRALEKQPARRYPSAAELAADVERYLSGEPVLAGPPSTLYRLQKLARRHRVAVAALAVVALTITAGAVVSSLSLLRAVEAERGARVQLRASLLNQAMILVNSNELDRRARALAALKEAAEIQPGLDARNIAIGALSTPAFRLLRRWSPASQGLLPVGGSAYSVWPDRRLRRYARANPDGSVSLHSTEDDAELLRLPAVSTLADHGLFSPDGSWLAVDYHNEELHVWNLSSRTNRLMLKSAFEYQFTPDSRRLVASSQDNVHVFDLMSGREIRREQAGVPPLVRPAVHPSEPLFLVPNSGSRELEIRSTDDGSVVRRLTTPELGFAGLWSADGKHLITAHLDFSIRVWDWPSLAAPRLLLRFHRSEPVHLATDPSGRLLATGGWDNETAFFDLRDGRLLLNQPGTDVFASADRSTFVLVNGAEWSLIELEPAFAFDAMGVHEREKGPRWPAFSANGRWLATAGPAGVRVLDPRARQVHHVLDDEQAFAVAFSPDSTELRAITLSSLRTWRLETDDVAGRLRPTPGLQTERPERPGKTHPPSQDDVVVSPRMGSAGWLSEGTRKRNVSTGSTAGSTPPRPERWRCRLLAATNRR